MSETGQFLSDFLSLAGGANGGPGAANANIRFSEVQRESIGTTSVKPAVGKRGEPTHTAAIAGSLLVLSLAISFMIFQCLAALKTRRRTATIKRSLSTNSPNLCAVRSCPRSVYRAAIRCGAAA